MIRKFAAALAALLCCVLPALAEEMDALLVPKCFLEEYRSALSGVTVPALVRLSGMGGSEAGDALLLENDDMMTARSRFFVYSNRAFTLRVLFSDCESEDDRASGVCFQCADPALAEVMAAFCESVSADFEGLAEWVSGMPDADYMVCGAYVVYFDRNGSCSMSVVPITLG